jgi:hypothetical protein
VVSGDGSKEVGERERPKRGKIRREQKKKERERRHNGEETEETGSGREGERRGWVINAGV